MSIQNYKEFAKFRVLTLSNIKTKRTTDLVLKDIDKELRRISNSIVKGYTLPNYNPNNQPGYKPYKYFEISWSEIENEFDLNVVITRGAISLVITPDNWASFDVWCSKWKKEKPKTLAECEMLNFYDRWWM